MVGRPVVDFWILLFNELFDKTLYTNKRDAFIEKHHAETSLGTVVFSLGILHPSFKDVTHTMTIGVTQHPNIDFIPPTMLASSLR